LEGEGGNTFLSLIKRSKRGEGLIITPQPKEIPGKQGAASSSWKEQQKKQIFPDLGQKTGQGAKVMGKLGGKRKNLSKPSNIKKKQV